MIHIETWIKLSRDIINWQWYHDDNAKSVFLHIALSVRWKEGFVGNTKLNAGEMLTTQCELAERLGKSRYQIRTALDALKSSGAIQCTSAKGKTLIKVSKYAYSGPANNKSNAKFRQGYAKDLPNNRPDINNIYNNYKSIEERKEGNKYQSDHSRTDRENKCKYGTVL